jgi:hypothetical protein
MNDLTNWKIIELHRRGADKQTWYFGVTKPDGKRLYANTPSGHERVIYSAKAPSPVKISTADGGYNGTNILKVHALSEAGAVRKIMRYVDALATDWNTRLAIKEAGMKEVNFAKRKPDIIPAERQLEAGPSDRGDL